jgi:hypothetical protein
MVPSETKIVKLFTPATVAAAATTTGCVDTLGYDYCTIDVMAGSIASNATAVTYLQVSESETAMTAYTDGDAIVALTGAAAVSATAGFVLPAPSTCTVVPTGCNYRMNIDLKGRKRYLTLLFTPAQTVAQCAWATLSRVQNGPAMETISPITNSTVAYQCHLNVSA